MITQNRPYEIAGTNRTFSFGAYTVGIPQPGGQSGRANGVAVLTRVANGFSRLLAQ